MKHIIIFFLIVITGCASLLYETEQTESVYGHFVPKQRLLSAEKISSQQHQSSVSFLKDVKPILDSRCVVCHGCYDAPCQLKLGSIEGIDRGATKKIVYEFGRFKAADPTRLFIDAQNTGEWRKKTFFPVLNEGMESKPANLDNSLLVKLIQLKRDHPLPASGKLDEDFALDYDRDLQCPKMEEFPQYQREHAKWGMPYAMPGLSKPEENIITQWLEEGAKAEPFPPASKQAAQEVTKWENYFNGSSLKQKLVFRYIYEHLFIGNIHFMGHPGREFFRLVRSKTPTGQPIEEINTVRPFDDPGTSEFYYRLRPVTETIVDKIHFVYELSDQKQKRFDDLFFSTDYQVTSLPSYSPEVAANPFKAFAVLPMVSRYQFLLDDAEYFVSGFIKGPVCRGEIATESIRDRFWIVFLQPGKFFPEKVAKALAENSDLLALPAAEADNIGLLGWTKYDALGKDYLKKKDQFIATLLPKNQGFGLEHIWDGDGDNQNAALTVFRHYNSATVVKGFIGATPLTGWVVDYPLLERLHYLLVAGFNVYGTAGHLVASRTYMDILRQGGEDNFLRFMPAMERRSIYNSWYLGSSGLRTADPVFNIHHETQVKFKTTNYTAEFFDQVRLRLGAAAGEKDSINHCREDSCLRANTNILQQQVDREMRQIAELKGLELRSLPEMSLLRVKTGDPQNDLIYTLLVDKNYSNLSKMLSADSRRLPENDKLTIVPGIIGSYPNFFFSVERNLLDEFKASIKNTSSMPNSDQLYTKFGIRRTNPEIWQQADWFNQQHQKYNGIRAGLLDLSRYENL